MSPNPEGNKSTGAKTSSVVAAVILGVVAIVAVLTLTFMPIRRDEFQQNVLWAILALGVGGAAAVLPGAFQIQISSFVRAGGALGIFVLVYTQSPAGQRAIDVIWPNSSTNPEVVAMEFLEKTDGRMYDQAFDKLSGWAKDRYRHSFEELIRTHRLPLGDPLDRQLYGTNAGENIPGFPAGGFQSFVWKTEFSERPNRPFFEFVVLGGSEDEWVVYSYWLSDPEVLPSMRAPLTRLPNPDGSR